MLSTTEYKFIFVTMTPGWPRNRPDLTIKEITLYSAAMTPESLQTIHNPLQVTCLSTLHPFLSLETNQLRKMSIRGFSV